RSLTYQGDSGVPGFLGPDFRCSAFVISADSPAIAYSTVSHEFLVVYNRLWDIRGRRFTATGDLIGTEVSYGSSADYEMHPNVTYNPNANEYFIVWKYFSDPLWAGTIQGVRAQGGTGAIVGSQV